MHKGVALCCRKQVAVRIPLGKATLGPRGQDRETETLCTVYSKPAKDALNLFLGVFDRGCVAAANCSLDLLGQADQFLVESSLPLFPAPDEAPPFFDPTL